MGTGAVNPFEYLEGDSFSFACHPGLACFTECCRDLRLSLTPYDILRLKNRLGLPSDRFLDRYTRTEPGEGYGFPQVLLNMEENEGRTCPFVTPQGCRVYSDRPGACRIYPIGRATARRQQEGNPREVFFVVREGHCLGFSEPQTWTVKDWTEDQGLGPYNRFNDLWMEIITRRAEAPSEDIRSRQMGMFFLSAYNLDRFRKFVFETTFLDRFLLEEEEVQKIREDDEALLLLSFRFLKFSLFGEKTLPLRTPASAP
jgi:Fe-S-cluster containining protein